MPFYDGTTDYTVTEFEREYPRKINDNLFTSSDGTKAAIINDIPCECSLYRLADPMVEKECPEYIFYQPFFKESAKAAEDFFRECSLNYDEFGLVLFRKEKGQVFSYAYGEIAREYLKCQVSLKTLLPEELADEVCFILPLRRHMFKCPVCGKRTLPEPGMCMICPVCGWEDDGTVDEETDECTQQLNRFPELLISGTNGDYSVREYREEYLFRKLGHPEYSWEKEVSTEEAEN